MRPFTLPSGIFASNLSGARCGAPCAKPFAVSVRSITLAASSVLMRGPRSRSAFRLRRLVERGAQPLGELDSVVVCPEVHEDQPRLFAQHVTVDRRHLDAALPQLLDH